MKQLIDFLGSMKTMAIMMLIFAFAIGYATFIENDYGTITAKAEVYNAKWFEILLTLLSITLIINIIKFKMYKKKKIPIFMFHVSFLIILIGASLTRFVGFEGSMHIREGDSVSTMLSLKPYFNVTANDGKKETSSSDAVYLSKKSSNTLTSSLELDDKKIDIQLVKYTPDAIDATVEAKDGGSQVLQMMVTDGSSSNPIELHRGEFYENDSIALDFESGKMFLRETISIYVKDGKLFMKHQAPLTWLKMDDRSQGNLEVSDKTKFDTRTLYSINGSNFVLRKFYKHGVTKVISNPKASAMMPEIDALEFKVTVNDVSKNLIVYGQPQAKAKNFHIQVNGVDVDLSYGSKTLELPFALKLIDFQLDRYPGSMSPASYASEVILIDKQEGVEMPYRIFMNNILEHRGYRFFQSSYDRDEKGTVLSVNNDPGTLPSYIGYFLLGLGMFWSLFSRENRFAQLSKRAKKASADKVLSIAIVVMALFSSVPSFANDIDPSIKTILSLDKNHANEFGKLIIQDSAGRMKPMDTLTTEILAKVHRSSHIKIGSSTLNSNQVILGMMIKPDEYRTLKMIRTKNNNINNMIGTKVDAKYASFSQFFADPATLKGYKLAGAVDTAVRKEPKNRDLFDKAVIKVDERVNICYSVYSGTLMKLWAKPNDINNKWFPTIEALQTFNPENAEHIRDIVFKYFTALEKAISTGNWSKANTAIKKLNEYQSFYGSSVMPTTKSIEAEILYNKTNIFETIYPIYFILGFILLILSFTKILKPKFNMGYTPKIALSLLTLLFIAHTFGLALRWYISGHAPWSNGYESMIYISWATVLSGFIFSKQSPMTMASTAILTGLILMVAHLNWMDPTVTNLVPVLNSYWLSIHVAVITASYGFLGLGALLGFITILLFILKNKNNEKHISLSIKELNAINEMSLMIGLALLTLGNFLGGVWANESWGRYWGWDPKETWALVTILVYAVVVHLRFIKALYSDFNYSVISLLSFTSVLMTYFGVNYYLAGMHSYAKGDPVPVPEFVPITYAILFVVILLAFRNRKLA
jgi:cytochrome c-type biogenesis protein CcsB